MIMLEKELGGHKKQKLEAASSLLATKDAVAMKWSSGKCIIKKLFYMIFEQTVSEI